MNKTTEITAKQKKYLWPNHLLYYTEPLPLERGDGMHVWDVEGKKYLDFFGGILTTCVGHNRPEVVQAVKEQTEKLIHSSTLYPNEAHEWLREIQPMLWRQGRTFPESVTQLHQLFRNGEVDFTMSNNDGEVDNKVIQGILPETSRAYVLDSGTIRNSHYLGIPFNAPNPEGAMIVASFLLSPEALLKKAQPAVWGDGTILDISKLPEEWQGQFQKIEGRSRVASREELKAHALMEPSPEIMIRLEADFRHEIIERGQK